MTRHAPHGVPPWRLAIADDVAVARLAEDAGVSQVVSRILVSRGVTDAQAARRFLAPDLGRDWHDPDEIPGMTEAAERVAAAVSARERIVVFGDFDLDGISSAALLTLALRDLGGEALAVVPHRFREGYGLTPPAIARVLELEPALVVTVDCGISAAEEVATLRAATVDVVVTDHHEPGADMPTGVPVANPKLPGGCFAGLAGAGVALKLAQAVGRLLGQPDAWRAFTDLAALGTIADVVPLVAENRALVADGLERIRTAERPGIAALADVAGVSLAELDADRVAFALAPRLNAAGRMADPVVALELLLTTDRERAAELARLLDEHNRLRQAAEADLLAEALAQANERFAEDCRVLVLSGEAWHEGVKGIVAARIAGRFGVPTLLFAIEDGTAVGSGRSAGSVDLFAAISSCADLLQRFGGHAAAVGATIPAEDLPTLEARLAAHLATLPAEAFLAETTCDAELPLEAIGREIAAELDTLQPFGSGNPRPLLGTRGVFMNGRQRVGGNGEHLRFTAFDGAASVGAIAFRCREPEALVEHEAAIDLAYNIDVDSWQGRERVQLLVRHLHAHTPPADAPAAELVDDLFAHADEILAAGEYAHIGEAESFHTKLAGVTFEGRQELLADLAPGAPLRLVRQHDNAFDANACALLDPLGRQLGFFNRRLAAALAPVIDAGVEFDVEVTDVTGGGADAGAEQDRSRGVNVLVTRRQADDADRSLALAAALERRAELAALDERGLTAALVRQFIGDRQVHDAQAASLAHLASGSSCLAVMATGRGKSLIFHVHAARLAIARGQASVFVYPLRALVADQAFHLEDAFAELGLQVRTVTGETSPGSRDEAFAALAEGSLDVVMTTPEFLDHHVARFAEAGRVGFLVVDEAHHVGLARAGHRPAYARLGRAAETLGSPTVLAVTATANDEVASAIIETLGIREVVLDPTVRENLAVVDKRGCADKASYVASLAARGEKVVVYVTSRDTSVNVAKMLRSKAPGLRDAVAFYNGGMTRASRHAVERAFRSGDVRCVIATSAFGEGVNIPDVRHIVLYHLPMNGVEFNQVCGRAGRDGAPASIHLAYGAKDARLNELILASLAPERDDLAALYLVLRDAAADSSGVIEVTNAELAERVRSRRRGSTLSDSGASAGIGVFRELGFVSGEGAGSYRRLTLQPAERKVELTESVRYTEGREEIEGFATFKRLALGALASDLLGRINRPIVPQALAQES